MKTSELHQLIGRPAFVTGDRVLIKATGQIGWMSHINIGHVVKRYWYMIVDKDENYIRKENGSAAYREEELTHAQTE